MTAPVVPSDPGVEPSAPGRGLPSRSLIAVAAVLLVVVALVGFLAYQRSTASTLEANRRQVVAVASEQAVAMLSYTPANVDTILRGAVDGLTESFAAEYSDLLDSVVVPSARETGTTSEVAVVGAAVSDVERSSATVLLFLNQTTTSFAAPEPTVTGSRVTVALERVDGTWLVGDLTAT